MANGNFSNGGRDTFDAAKRYIGIRLQQGVPLLDRDWNELEDIRRHYEWMLRENYVGEGTPDADGFAVVAPHVRAERDFVIRAGRYSVGGYDVWNEKDVFFSSQGDRRPLPETQADDVIVVYLEPRIARIGADEDPDLANTQDVNIVTSVRDRLDWAVVAVREPGLPPAGAVVLAEIHRPAGSTHIEQDMIVDRRRTKLSLATSVDRIGHLEERLETVQGEVQAAQADIATMKQELGRLFWDVTVESSSSDVLWGARVSITVTVKNRLGTAIEGANLTFASDWGSLNPAFAATDADGHATIEFVGVHSDHHPPIAHVGLLQQVIQRVQLASLPNPGAVQHARLRFEPEELSLISRYAPVSTMVDLARDLPATPIVARPLPRSATVTVHATEASGAIVRGVGSVQVTFGFWMRDWMLSKIQEVTANVAVGARVGDVMRQGVAEGRFDHGAVTERLPVTLQAMSDDTHLGLKRSLFLDPAVEDDSVHGSGQVSQVIAQEATAAIGQRANDAIVQQLDQLVASQSVALDAAGAAQARTHIVQASSTIHAGFAQRQRQLFTGARQGF